MKLSIPATLEMPSMARAEVVRLIAAVHEGNMETII
jgi:hypothetical protein